MSYTIREVARIFGNTVGGIRFYEEAGLVHPDRDSSDNRVYTLENILELFYLRKYCTFGLKIREVMEYFTDQNTKEIQDVSGLLKTKQREAEEQARYYQHSAEWIGQYNEKLENLETYIHSFTPEQPEDYLLLMDDALVSKSKQHQDVIKRWIAVSPMSRILRIAHIENKEVRSSQSAFAIRKSLAEELNLPMPAYTRVLRGAPCMYRVVKQKSSGFTPIPDETLVSLINQIEEQGRRCSGLTASSILFTHRINGVQYKYFELWVPVDTELPLIL
jgi:DNA-binding transcriptional MerR regulator